MVRFPQLSEREKHLIVLLHQETNLSYALIARELGNLFPEDNDGSRDKDTIYSYLKKAGYI